MSQSGTKHKIDMYITSNLGAYPKAAKYTPDGIPRDSRRGDVGTGQNTGSANQDLKVKGDFAADAQTTYKIDTLLNKG